MSRATNSIRQTKLDEFTPSEGGGQGKTRKAGCELRLANQMRALNPPPELRLASQMPALNELSKCCRMRYPEIAIP